MKQQQLTDLAMRKIYHAEQIGMDASTVQLFRDSVRDINAKLDHAARYIDREAVMLNVTEKTFMLERRWADFIVSMTEAGQMTSEWIRLRVKSPGGLKLGKAS